MTLAGTRPILQDELLKYELHHRARIAIKPGITGMWQVSGRSDVMHVAPSESVVVCPVDPYVEDGYFEALKELSEQADKCEANLVLMGIEPTYPSEKYGYIIPESADHVAEVRTFREKPAANVAEQYIAQGALWNGGVFAYKLGYVMDKAHEMMDFTDYQDLFDKYDTMKKISFDYAVAEHGVCQEVQR